LMSTKDIFLDRYYDMGYDYQEVELQQAIRFNNVNARGKNLVDRMETLGVHLKKIPFLEQGYWVLDSKVSVGATAEYLLGLYSVQEAAAQIPATLFSNLKGKKVLDLAAAPGGKTTQLADLMDNTGTIVALDVEKYRLNALSNHLERCHVANTVVYQMDARHATDLDVRFDRILADVPCSGNFAGDRFWFKNRTPKDVERNSKLQRQILSKAVECLTPDGEIIYSTCSLEPEEDEFNIDWAIKNLDLQTQEINCPGQAGLTEIFGEELDSSISRCRRLWPGETQGFFVCKLGRKKQ
jgi:tRNA (cytosine40_48-C5)-methyltransferase